VYASVSRAFEQWMETTKDAARCRQLLLRVAHRLRNRVLLIGWEQWWDVIERKKRLMEVVLAFRAHKCTGTGDFSC
jgi:hypothetical protein